MCGRGARKRIAKGSTIKSSWMARLLPFSPALYFITSLVVGRLRGLTRPTNTVPAQHTVIVDNDAEEPIAS